MDDHDNPFKEVVDDSEDGSAVDELEFDLHQLRQARSDLAPENLDADGLADFDRKVEINESRPLSADEIVNEYLHNLLKPLKMASVMRMRFPTNPYYHH